MIKKIMPALFVLFAGCASVFAGPQREFSATMVTTAEGHAMTGKVFCKNDKMRYEMPQAVTITRPDKGVSYVLMPAQNMYMEQPIDSDTAAKSGVEQPGELERTPMGPDTVDGRSAEKFKVSYSSPKGSVTVYQWVDGQGIPVRVEDADGRWSVEYRDVSPAPQPDELFEVPAGYQRFVMPSMNEMMAAAGMSEEPQS